MIVMVMVMVIVGLVNQLNEYSFIRIVNKCFTKEFVSHCEQLSEHKHQLRSLTRRFRLLYIVSFVVFVVLTLYSPIITCAPTFGSRRTTMVAW